ncbi:MAG: TatD family hydrolase [Holosporaceae bacterium]|jgi:TatD DNase family protein|nr:TatD family hydrolase [Holosporaceae bacterium]
MFFVDSHCHLLFPKFYSVSEKLDEEKYCVAALLDRAEKAGVKYLLIIGTELADVDEIQSIADSHDNVFRTVGIHPLEAAKHCASFTFEEISSIIRQQASSSKIVAIGEIGLDYHYEKESQKQQKELFNLQLDLAQECSLPVVIHSREAYPDVVAVLKDYPRVTGVIHCFSGEKDFARKALDLGFYISISGVVTYKNAVELQETIKMIPLDRMLLETDSPFLAPVPHRGQINEPAFIPHIAEKISKLMNVPVETLAQRTSENFFRLFCAGIGLSATS